MTAYNAAEADRLIAEARDQERRFDLRSGHPDLQTDRSDGAVNRLTVLLASQLEAARAEIDRLRTSSVGFIPSDADRVTLGRIHDAAPPVHVGDLARRLIKRVLAVACPVQSIECAVRAMCINKCGALDRAEVRQASEAYDPKCGDV